MCGIAGYITRSVSRETASPILSRMLGRLARRGPDGEGQWSGSKGEWRIALGHRRLSIIDLEGGAQPLGNEDGVVQVTFNGEVFNFQGLRAALESSGHRFRTRSDTEVIVHHFEEHGSEGLAKLNGMFAFALWDGRTGQLVLARDRAGIKPLYYAPLADGGLAFASELTSLIQHPGVSRELDHEALGSYFFSDYLHPPLAALRGVRKLAPGHFLVWQGGRLSDPRAFWRLDARTTAPDKETDPKLLSAQLWERLRGAVERQLVADVPVGVFLSGGIDSSCVAALARELSARPPSTFSIRFEEKDFDESLFARKVAAHLGTSHVEETFSEAALLEGFEEALSCLDEPLADPSILPTYWLSRLASRHVKVILGGDGGDELWAGYPTYRAHRYAEAYRRMPGFVRRKIENAVRRLPASFGYQSFEWKAKRFALRWDDDPVTRHLRWMSNTDLTGLEEAFPRWRARPAVLESPLIAKGARDSVALAQAVDFLTYLPGSVLTKVDRASMANGLEVRPPFLDNEIIDWAFALPSDLKLRRGTGKYLLKMAASGHLPEEIIHRRKKGFAIPLARWLRGPLKARVDGVLATSPLWRSEAISRRAFAGWNDRHQAGAEDHSRPLWALLVLDHWIRREGISV